MNYNDLDIVKYNGEKLILRIFTNPITNKKEYFLYTLDGKLYTKNFSLDELESLIDTNNVNMNNVTSSNTENYSSNSNRSVNQEDVDIKVASSDSANAKKLSDNIGSLLKTEKTMIDCKVIIDKAKEIVNTANITVNTWNDSKNAEGLATEASIVFLNNLSDCLDSIINNLNSTSSAANSLNNLNTNLKVLLIKFSEKKEKEDNLKLKEAKFASTPEKIPDGTDTYGRTIYKTNPEYTILKEEINKLKEEIAKLESEIEILQNVIDAQYKNIRAKYSELSNLGTFENGINFETSGNIFGTSGTVSDDYKLMLVDVGDKMNLYTYDGEEFLVCNTAISLDDYVKYINDNKMYQNKGFMGSRCLELASIYAEDMISGTYTNKEAFKNSGIYNRIDSVRSNSEEEILENVYNEVTSGRPVALQVSQMRGNGTRHFVTVVGFKNTVSGPSDLTPENILVLDDVDGRVQTLSERNRTLVKHGSTNTYGVNISKVETVNA
ncbi:MAG: hypothetical protein IJ568_03395 [Bacilli bacterium]|nr:hypothetical protein [Bacilli bacterium]